MKRSLHHNGNTFVGILIFLVIISVAGYIVYNNPDFQKANRSTIRKFRFYTRDITKSVKEFQKNAGERIEQWQQAQRDKKPKSSPFLSKDGKPRPFEELIYDQKILNEEVPGELMRHQPDEITFCSFDANFLFNSQLNDEEILHLANILRFCELSAISGLKDEYFLIRISSALKLLRYNASYQASARVGPDNKSFYAFLYRSDRIDIISPGRILDDTSGFPVKPYVGQFKSGDFDFTIIHFQTAKDEAFPASISALETLYETVKQQNPDVKDIVIFGDLSFQSSALNWNNQSLLPAVARVHGQAKTSARSSLSGNVWFRKNDLVEFNGKSGTIAIKERLFPSAKPPLHTPSANRPIWAQFKIMKDDD